MSIATQREQAARARRVARNLHSDAESKSFRSYAAEIEAEIAKLEARAAVLQQAANEIAQASTPEGSIAALKTEEDKKPER